MRGVLAVPCEGGRAFDREPVGIPSPDLCLRTSSPLGQIPALEDRDFRPGVSGAVLDAIEPRYGAFALIAPDARAAERARCFDRCAAVDLHRRRPIVLFERFLRPRVLKITGDEALARRASGDEFPPRCDDRDIDIDAPFPIGDAFGPADLAAAAPVRNLRLAVDSVDAARWPKRATV